MKTVSSVLAAFCSDYPEEWAKWLRLAQWSMRATPRPDRGNRSPYEMVCGLIPQGPIDALMAKLDRTRTLDPSSYVAGLVENLKHIHEAVGMRLSAELTARHSKNERDGELGTSLEVGDKVFLQRPPSGDKEKVSRRLQPRYYTQLFEIAKVLSPATVVLCDPNSKSTQLGFGQPVSVTRLVPYDLLSLEQPVDGTERLHLLIRTRDGSMAKAEVTHQSATGAVRLRMEDGTDKIVELQNEEYQWLGS